MPSLTALDCTSATANCSCSDFYWELTPETPEQATAQQGPSLAERTRRSEGGEALSAEQRVPTAPRCHRVPSALRLPRRCWKLRNVSSPRHRPLLSSFWMTPGVKLPYKRQTPERRGGSFPSETLEGRQRHGRYGDRHQEQIQLKLSVLTTFYLLCDTSETYEK